MRVLQEQALGKLVAAPAVEIGTGAGVSLGPSSVVTPEERRRTWKEMHIRIRLFRHLVAVRLGDIFIRALAITRGLASRKGDNIDRCVSVAATAATLVPLPGLSLIAGALAKLTSSWRTAADRERQLSLLTGVGGDLISAARLVDETADVIAHDYQRVVSSLSRADGELLALTAVGCMAEALQRTDRGARDGPITGTWLAASTPQPMTGTAAPCAEKSCSSRARIIR